jgi:hypothetical protein
MGQVGNFRSSSFIKVYLKSKYKSYTHIESNNTNEELLFIRINLNYINYWLINNSKSIILTYGVRKVPLCRSGHTVLKLQVIIKLFRQMSNLHKLNGWAGENGYVSRTSAQSYLASDKIHQASSGCGSSCGSKEGEGTPKPSSCGTGDCEPKPSACGAGDSSPKPSACGAGEGDSKPKTSACGSSCGAGEK